MTTGAVYAFAFEQGDQLYGRFAAFRSSYLCHCDVQLSPQGAYAMPYWRLESHLETILGSPCHYAPHLLHPGWPPVRHSFRHAHPYLVSKRGQPSRPSGQIVPSRPNTPLDRHLFDREPYGLREGEGESNQTLIIFGRVEGWAGLEALVSHRPLCHHSHAKIPSKDAVQLTGTHLPNQVLSCFFRTCRQ
jgi:hypothetical protein